MSPHHLIRRATLTAQLRRAAVFEGLCDAELSRIAGYSREISMPKGGVIFREGDPVTAFFIVSRGVVESYRTGPCGDDRMIHLVHPGESFAEAAVASPLGYLANARALEAAEIVAIESQPFLIHISERPELALRMLATLGRRMRGLVAVIEGYQLRDTESRLLRWLLDRCDSPTGPATVTLATTRAMLATELGTRRETLSRLLTRLRGCGVIQIEGRKIQISDTALLYQRLDDRRAGS